MSDAENRGKAIDPVANPKNSTLNDVLFSQTVDSNAPQAEVSPTQHSLEAGDKLGKYEIRKKLGQGGMGAVYLAFDPMIEREVAIKVLPPQVASQPQALDRFLSEARATGRLNHPNVVAIHDIATESDIYYIVMELVRGGSAAEFIANRDAIDWREACNIAADACDGLAAAHAAGLVHRDIKPENLMLTDEGVVKVVDFGLSKLVDVANETRLGLTNAGQILGTPLYMSPEQFQSERVDSKSDVYGMGGTFYSLLTGQPPFADATNVISLMTSHLRSPPPDPAKLNSEIPAACGRIIEKAMAKEPDQRYRDAGGLASAIREILSDSRDSDATGVTETYRPLQTVVIVEPSKMQAMMLENGLKSAGVSTAAVYGSVAEARQACECDPPDLLITAMQLADGKGIDLIRGLRDNRKLRDTVLVLNSSDLELEQIVEVVQRGPLAVIQKKTKPGDLLEAVHGCTFLNAAASTAQAAIDPTSLRFGIVSDASRLPDPIAALIRRASLLDVQVKTFDELAAGKDFVGTMDFVMGLRDAGEAANDGWLYTNLLSRMKLDAKVLAAVQVDGQQVTLRAIRRSGFAAVSRCPLDDDRLMRVVQLCEN